MEKIHTPFDETETYRTKMLPLLQQLKQIANESKISFVAVTQYAIRDRDDSSVEVGMGQITVLHGVDYTVPCVVAASQCAQDPKKAVLALALQAAIETVQPHRNDPRFSMMEDGTDEELAKANDAVASLLGHTASANPSPEA